MSRVACLWDPTTGPSQVSMTENAARALKLKLQVVEVRQRDDVAGAFRAARDGQAQAANVFASPFLASLYQEIIGRAAEYRLPAIYQWKEHTEAGGLMSYGPSLPAMWEQAATIAVKILKGAKPSDMPVEQPTKFELTINLKTAKALGLAVPSTLLATADDVVFTLAAAAAAELLELGEHCLDIELFAGLFRLGGLGLFLRRRRHCGRQ
jgi:putative ABC transport system substrate-binding protein